MQRHSYFILTQRMENFCCKRKGYTWPP